MPTPGMNGPAVVVNPLRTTDLQNMLHLYDLEGEILWYLRSYEDRSLWFATLVASLLGREKANLVLPRLLGCYLMYVEVAQVAAGGVSVSGSLVPVVSGELFDTRLDDPCGLRAAAVIYVESVRNRDQTTLESLQGAATAAITARKQKGGVVPRPTDYAAFQAVQRLTKIALEAMEASASEEGS